MATTRATGYVVTAAVWNAVLSGLSDAGVFTGTITTSGTATFNGSSIFQGSGPALFYGPSATAIAVRVRGRSSDNTGILDFTDNGATTQYATLTATSTGLALNTGSTARTFTFSGGRVNSNTVQPAAVAYRDTDATGVTTGATVALNAELYDQASNFASNVFTAPVTGHYLVSGAATVTNTSGSAGDVAIELARTATSNAVIAGASLVDVPNNDTVCLVVPAVVVPLYASDTIKMVYAGAAQVTVVGETGVPPNVILRTFLSVRLML